MIEFALRTYLLTLPAITNLVGERVFVEMVDQEEPRPLLVLKLSGGERTYHTRGPCSLVEADIMVSVQAATYVKARELYDAVRVAVDGFKGQWGDVEIDRAGVSAPVSGSFAPAHGDETGIPAIACTVNCHYLESVPDNIQEPA